MTESGTFSSARVEEVEYLCQEKLAQAEASAEARGFGTQWMKHGHALALVRKVADEGNEPGRWDLFLSRSGKVVEPGVPSQLARMLLLRAALNTVGLITQLRIAEEVKGRLLDQFVHICLPDGTSPFFFEPNHYGFQVMCKFVCLKRFPTGQLDWEISAFPRSWLLKIPGRDLTKMLFYLVFKTRGHKPFFETHLALRRETACLTETAERKSFELISASLILQPEIKGFSAASWMLDPHLSAVSPHLQWLTNWYKEWVDFGAVWTHVGFASPDSGFIIGDRRRKKLYDAGEWRPMQGLVVWARQDMIFWYEHHYGNQGAIPRD